MLLLLILTILVLPNILVVANRISDSPPPASDQGSRNFQMEKKEEIEEVDMNKKTGFEFETDNKLEIQKLTTQSDDNGNLFSDKDIQMQRKQYSDQIRFTHNPDGTTTAEFNIKPVYYCDLSCTQLPIDTTIELSEYDNPVDSYQYRCVKNNLKVYFQKQYSPSADGNLICLKNTANQYPLIWQPLKISMDSDVDMEKSNQEPLRSKDHNFLSTNGQVTENEIIYENLYPGCEDRYVVLPNKLKHDFILNRFPNELLQKNSTTLRYFGILTLPGALVPYLEAIEQTETFETSKIVELRTKDTGETIYRIPEPIAFEQSDPEQRIACSYEFIPLAANTNSYCEGSGAVTWTQVLVILKTDLEWLIAPQRHYPVVIDPDLETPDYDEGEVGYDTYLVQGNETEPEWNDYNFGKSPNLKVTIAGPSIFSREHLLHRTILKFPGIDIIPSYAQITKAELYLWGKNEGNMSITVFRLFDNWIEGAGTEAEPGSDGATWKNSGYNIWLGGNYDGYNTDHKTLLVLGQETAIRYCWDIKDIVKSWVTDPVKNPNNGLLLTGTDNEDVIKEFYSSDSSDASRRPQIKIIYNTPPRPSGIDAIHVFEGEHKVIDMNDIFYDPDAGSVVQEEKLSFRLWNGSAFVLDGDPGSIYYNETYNFSAELKFNELIITPYEDKQEFGVGTVRVQAKDKQSNWLEVKLIINVSAVNDPPIFTKINDEEILDDYFKLNVEEDRPIKIPIEIYDPDNLEFLENKTEKKDGAPGDLEFRWEDKSDKFTISTTEDTVNITFNPDNSLVGTFHINITVYDTVWKMKKVGNRNKYFKNELSNSSIELIFTVKNTNDPPNKPRILEPKEFNEFSTDDTITFRGTCSDDDFLTPETNEKLTYKWLSGENTPLGQGQDFKKKLSKGTHLITLRVEDREGAFNEVNRTIKVRNRATIDELNCSNYFIDDLEDVLCFYYESTDEGVEDFKAERGSFVKYNVFDIDITDLTSQRFGQYLMINLTINENISSILIAENYKYEFSIFLVKPRHSEVTIDLNGIKFSKKQYTDLYKPADYYAKFTLDEKEYSKNGLDKFKITHKGKTLTLPAHLGDLEAGEDNTAKLTPDFSVFAIVKIEVEQHPLGLYQKIVCYDSVGHGGKTAPYPQQFKSSSGENEKGPNIVIVTIIIILLTIFLIFRREAESKAKAKGGIVLDTTKLSVGQRPSTTTPIQGHMIGTIKPSGMPMNMPISPPLGMPGIGMVPPPGFGFIPPPMIPIGGMGKPMLPPTNLRSTTIPGQITQVSPVSPKDKSKKDKKKKGKKGK